jgi:hypothetical protein
MRLFGAASLTVGVFAILVSCASDRAAAPALSGVVRGPGGIANLSLSPVRISEFHYDNTGTDADEKIEISGPAGTSLVGWQIVRYNGNPSSRAPYTAPAIVTGLPAEIPPTAACGVRGVVVITYAANGLQNGGSGSIDEPDGFALVNAAGQVVEFLSYEGSFVAASGVAAGMTSTVVGVRDVGSEQINPVTSIKRNGAGVWSGPGTAASPNLHNFGICNDHDEPPPPATVDHVTVSPATTTVTVGTGAQFTARAFDATDQPIPSTTFSWTSSDDLTATVSAAGFATTLKSGEVTITASAPNGVSGTATLSIESALPATRFSELHYD